MIKTVCFLTTYRCNARCGFCECRHRDEKLPELTFGDLREKRMVDAIEEANND